MKVAVSAAPSASPLGTALGGEGVTTRRSPPRPFMVSVWGLASASSRVG
jgi:hypothetical protein